MLLYPNGLLKVAGGANKILVLAVTGAPLMTVVGILTAQLLLFPL